MPEQQDQKGKKDNRFVDDSWKQWKIEPPTEGEGKENKKDSLASPDTLEGK